MEAARILLIGRVPSNQSAAGAVLEKRYPLLIASSGKQGSALALEQRPQLIVLDAVSMRTPGDRICQDIRRSVRSVPILHIHPGPKAGPQNAADVILYAPITPRKLLAAVERLLQAPDDRIVAYGPFVMNPARRVLIVNGQETQLTPKQALLVETFFRHPGETLARKTLMEKVWNTDYVGDTRTLDVHIRWLRQAIEKDPGSPRYLLTVRGVGYRLEMPEALLPENDLSPLDASA